MKGFAAVGVGLVASDVGLVKAGLSRLGGGAAAAGLSVASQIFDAPPHTLVQRHPARVED
jgi:hypothetical protein